jgi:cysteine desulfurase
MYANNEIGTVEPVAEIAKIVSKFRGKKEYPLFHSDAAQAFQFLDCGVKKLGVDLLTLSSHKIYGPKGAGALYVRGGLKLKSLVTGGGQEFGLRSGTENVPAIVGFARAAELLLKNRAREAGRIAALKNYFWKELKKIYPKIEINGAALPSQSLPSILNIYFPYHTSEYLLTKFDINGLAASSGSACRSRALSPSYVIKALGYPEERARQSVRFSFGRPMTKSEIRKALVIIKNCLG